MKRTRNTISQAEARALRKRVQQLEQVLQRQRAVWSNDYPGGTHLMTLTYASDQVMAPTTVRTARRCGHSVVAIDSGLEVRLYALPHPDTPA